MNPDTVGTSSEQAAFLAAIQASPTDNMPRLAYADWLQDRDEPGDVDRAQLIRWQIAATILPVVSAPWSVTKTRQKEEFAAVKRTKRTVKARWEIEAAIGRELLGRDARLEVLSWDRGFIACVHAPSFNWWTHHAERLREREWIPLVSCPPPLLAGDEDGVGIVGGTFYRDWVDLKTEADRRGLDITEADTIARLICELRWPGTQFDFL